MSERREEGEKEEEEEGMEVYKSQDRGFFQAFRTNFLNFFLPLRLGAC